MSNLDSLLELHFFHVIVIFVIMYTTVDEKASPEWHAQHCQDESVSHEEWNLVVAEPIVPVVDELGGVHHPLGWVELLLYWTLLSVGVSHLAAAAGVGCHYKHAYGEDNDK